LKYYSTVTSKNKLNVYIPKLSIVNLVQHPVCVASQNVTCCLTTDYKCMCSSTGHCMPSPSRCNYWHHSRTSIIDLQNSVICHW